MVEAQKNIIFKYHLNLKKVLNGVSVLMTGIKVVPRIIFVLKNLLFKGVFLSIKQGD